MGSIRKINAQRNESRTKRYSLYFICLIRKSGI
jgi:hypothetical protein